jgi:tetratricopeptide (TPR) repeat protein
MQDEIVSRLANQLGTQLIAAEARRAEQAPDPDSMDLYFQGMACLNMGWIPEHMMQARGLFERALESDPDNIEALAGTAFVDYVSAGIFSVDDRAAKFATAEATFTKVLSLAPEHALGHLGLARVQIYTNRALQGITECERALALDRNLASAHAVLGTAKYFLGRAEETEAHINEAFRLSPRDTEAYVWLTSAGVAKFVVGRDEEAVALCRRSIEITETMILRTSVSQRPLRISVDLVRRGLQSKQRLRSIRPSRSRVSVLEGRATIPFIWLSAKAW